MTRRPPERSLGGALILGLLHGPTELLPISSSAHTTLLPWLAGRPGSDLDPRLRKSFEVALHGGTALALVLKAPTTPMHGRLSFLAAALVPPAFAGYVLGEQIERRLGGPSTIVAGLLSGSFAMLAADIHAKILSKRMAQGRPFTEMRISGPRPLESADVRDGLALGIAQAVALMPGVSRSGATLAAARWRGFSRVDADRLSWAVGLPVIAGATLLQGTRFALEQRKQLEQTPAMGRDRSRFAALPLAVGAAGAFLSTLACSKVLDRSRRVRLLPVCAAYRVALGLVVIRRMRDNTSATNQNPKK